MSSSTPAWRVLVARHAQKSVARAPKQERERLRVALEQMEGNPLAGDIKRLKNERTAFRRRVGDWRIFFDVHPEQHLVEVVEIQRRTTTTYRGR
jgi:mRNA-degrading endonuclease RelE of RelBE toxin-antitoxin system